MSIANGRPWGAGSRLGRLLAALILCNPWGADVAAQALAAGASTDSSPALVADGAALDVHTHVASPALTELFSVFAGEDLVPATADDLVARLDEGNVRRAVILSLGYLGAPVGWTDAAHMAAENDFVAAEVARHPDRLLGFCGINPVVEGAADEIDRCLGLPGMVGVKLHLEGSGVNLTDPAHVAGLGAVFDRVAERDAPVLMHVADERGYSLDNQRFAALSENPPRASHGAGGACALRQLDRRPRDRDLAPAPPLRLRSGDLVRGRQRLPEILQRRAPVAPGAARLAAAQVGHRSCSVRQRLLCRRRGDPSRSP